MASCDLTCDRVESRSLDAVHTGPGDHRNWRPQIARARGRRDRDRVRCRWDLGICPCGATRGRGCHLRHCGSIGDKLRDSPGSLAGSGTPRRRREGRGSWSCRNSLLWSRIGNFRSLFAAGGPRCECTTATRGICGGKCHRVRSRLLDH